MLVLNQLNYSSDLFENEINEEPSMTVPDQTLSMREIVERYTRNMPVDAHVYPASYDEGDLVMPDPSKMDLADREALADEYKAELKRINEMNKRSKAEDKSAKAERGAKKSDNVKDKLNSDTEIVSSELLPFPDDSQSAAAAAGS